jgi:RimJ/RimL family protein N-acetyltransferase
MEDQITVRTELVDVDENDHHFLVELHNDPDVLRNLTDPTPITLESHMRWWRGLNPDREVRKIFTINGQRAGFCKFYQIDKRNMSCVLGADLHRDFRGHGYSYLMWEHMLNECFFVMSLHRVSLTTAEYNDIAQRVYRKLGFLEEGKMVDSLFRDGRFYDQICMYMLKDHYLQKRLP